MATPTAAAANAYASIARLRDPAASLVRRHATARAAPTSATCSRTRWSAVTRDRHKSDVQTQAVAGGKANMVDVVTAVAETEVAIQALVSVRDKVIAAYEDIMKMPI